MNGVERSNDGVVLKRCPFCGGEAKLQRCFVPSESVVSLSYTVSCKSCLCKKGSYPTKELATEKWNTRTPVEEVLEQIQALANEFQEGFYHEVHCKNREITANGKTAVLVH